MGPVERRQIAKWLICMDVEGQATSDRLTFPALSAVDIRPLEKFVGLGRDLFVANRDVITLGLKLSFRSSPPASVIKRQPPRKQ
jgi:hypothetical protein